MTIAPQPHVVRTAEVIVDELSDGRLRFRLPGLTGFAVAGRVGGEVARAVRQALDERDRARELAATGQGYDLAEITERKDRL